MLDKNIRRPYLFEPYNPDWVKKFNSIKELVGGVFKEKVIDIQHVGSTSIPNMKAKPIIDVLVTVARMQTYADEKTQMESLGYKWGENYIEPDSIVFFKEINDGSKTENIHICVSGSLKAIQFIQTRDYLIAHPERALAYGNLKEKLKKQYLDDYPSYRAGKQSFLDETERLTYEWMKTKE